MPGSRSVAGDGEQPQRARLDLAGELAEAGDADRHLVAEDRGQRLAAAGEGDVVDLGRIDARRLGDQADGDVVDAAGRAAGPGDRARIGLQLRDEVVDRLDVGRRRHDDRLVFAGQAGDRRDVGQRRPATRWSGSRRP